MTAIRTLIAILGISFSFGVFAEGFVDYRGTVHPPLPGECKELTSRATYNDKKGTVLGFSYVECPAGNLLWFNKFNGRKNGVVTWEVLDAAVVTILARQTFLDIGCQSKTRPNDYVVAVGTWVKRGQGGYLADITAAWALDTEKRKLVELSPRTVTCAVEQD